MELLFAGKRRKVIGHEAIHLVLFVDRLLDDYTRGWTEGFAAAFDKFRAEVGAAKHTRYNQAPSEFWGRYGQLTAAHTEQPGTILLRHQFFTEKMYAWIKPVLKDPTRIFGPIERELIYYRDNKVCQVCALSGTGHEVPWSEHEIHHVAEHTHGGRTTLENGALVHKHCHPKGDAATAAFAEKWQKKLAGPATPPAPSSPDAKVRGEL